MGGDLRSWQHAVRRIWVVVCVAWPVPALAYDDPAVAVCQFAAFGGRDPAKDGFDRVAAEIDGSNVILTFGKSVLNTKPKLTEMSCRFEFGAGGIRLVGPHFPDEVRACIAILDEAPTKLYNMGTANKLYPAYKAKVETCEEQAGTALIELSAFRDIERLLTGLGIYPIDPSDTEMRLAPRASSTEPGHSACGAAREDDDVSSGSGSSLPSSGTRSGTSSGAMSAWAKQPLADLPRWFSWVFMAIGVAGQTQAPRAAGACWHRLDQHARPGGGRPPGRTPSHRISATRPSRDTRRCRHPDRRSPTRLSVFPRCLPAAGLHRTFRAFPASTCQPPPRIGARRGYSCAIASGVTAFATP